MSGYSGTPLWKKLGMKPGSQWAVVGAPEGFEIEGRPDAEPRLSRLSGALDGSVLFCRTPRQLEQRLDAAIRHLPSDGAVWVAWPRGSSPMGSKLDFSAVQGAGLARGLVDNKVCAIDGDWSGLRFVVRREDRVGWKGPS